MVVEARRGDYFEALVRVEIDIEEIWGPLEESKSYHLWGFLSVLDDEVYWLVSAPRGKGSIGLDLALGDAHGVFVGRAILV